MKPENISSPLHNDRFLRAVVFCIISHMLFALMSATAKYLSDTHHVVEIAFYRNIIAVVPFFLFLLLTRRVQYFKTQKPAIVAFRAVIGSISLIVSYAAISMLPMSYATVIFFTSSIFAPAMAHFVLREYIGIHRWSAIAFGMIGVVVIAQPSGTFSIAGFGFALMAAFLHAMMYNALRLLKQESLITVTFYFLLGGTLVPAVAMPWLANMPTTGEIPLFLLLGVSGGLAQFFLSNAYKYAAVSVITPFAYSGLLWSVLFDTLIWHYDLDYVSVFIGAALILCAQLYIIHREYVRKVQRETLPNVEK